MRYKLNHAGLGVIQWITGITASLMLVFLAGCTTTGPGGNIGGRSGASSSGASSSGGSSDMLTRAAQYGGPDRNPVILVPPFLASQLVNREDGTTFWDPFAGSQFNPASGGGVKLLSTEVSSSGATYGTSKPVEGAVSSGWVITDEPSGMKGLPDELQAYINVLRVLVAGGYQVQDLNLPNVVGTPGGSISTCFQFSYDWRLDNIGNAARLDDFVHEKREYLQREYKNRFGVEKIGLKFDLIAVGTGSLLSRYYLRYGGTDVSITGRLPVVTWAGARNIDHAIMVAPTSGGSLRYFQGLIQGLDCGKLGQIPAAVLGTMPGAYQLLPRSRHGAFYLAGSQNQPINDVLDPGLWQEQGWGLVSPQQERVLAGILPEISENVQRVEAGIAHQKKWLARAKYFQDALDQEARPPYDFDMRIVLGTGADTPTAMSADRRGGVRVIEQAEGDGLTSRTAALLDERRGGTWQPQLVSPIKWTRIQLINQDLIGLSNDQGFRDNLLHWLLEEPR